MKTGTLKSKWAILTPIKGYATKTDRRLCGEVILNNSYAKKILIYASSQSELDNKLNNLKNKLSKEYNVIVISDKQFGYIDGWLVNSNAHLDVATQKQLKSQYTLI